LHFVVWLVGSISEPAMPRAALGVAAGVLCGVRGRGRRYSAARVIAAEPESNTGTNFNNTANDQVRPIATTTATIVAIYTRTCIPPVVARVT